MTILLLYWIGNYKHTDSDNDNERYTDQRLQSSSILPASRWIPSRTERPNTCWTEA